MEPQIKQDNPFFYQWQIITLLIVSVFILLGTHTSIFSLVAFLICAYIVVFVRGEFSLVVLVYTMSFAHIFKISATGMSYFTFLILLYVVMSMIEKGEVPKCILFFGIYILLVQCFGGDFKILEDTKLLGNSFFLYYAFDESGDCSEKTIYLIYVLGVIIASFMRYFDSSFFHISDYARETIINHFAANAEIKSITRFSGIYDDPNYFGINVILALCVLLIMYAKRYLGLLSTVLLSIPLFYFSIMTGSKSVLIMSVLPFLIFVVANHKNKKYFVQILLTIGITLGALWFASGKIHFLDAILQRFEGKSLSNLNSFTSGRFDIWIRYVQEFVEHPREFLFGIGVGNTDNQVVAHNVYLESIKYIGLIGTGIFFYILKEVCSIRMIISQKTFLNFGGILTVLIMYVFLNQLHGYEFPIHLLLAFMILKIDFTKNKEEYV